MFHVDLLSVQKHVQFQMHNKQEAQNSPDPIFSGILEEGVVIGDIVTLNMKHHLDHIVG